MGSPHKEFFLVLKSPEVKLIKNYISPSLRVSSRGNYFRAQEFLAQNLNLNKGTVKRYTECIPLLLLCTIGESVQWEIMDILMDKVSMNNINLNNKDIIKDNMYYTYNKGR